MACNSTQLHECRPLRLPFFSLVYSLYSTLDVLRAQKKCVQMVCVWPDIRCAMVERTAAIETMKLLVIVRQGFEFFFDNSILRKKNFGSSNILARSYSLSDISFRLVNGSEVSGSVEVFFHSQWQPLCQQHFDANKICNSMWMGHVKFNVPKLQKKNSELRWIKYSSVVKNHQILCSFNYISFKL